MHLRIRQLREERGLTRQQLSQRSGITVQSIHRIETGKSKDPRLSTLRLLAKALDVTLTELLI